MLTRQKLENWYTPIKRSKRCEVEKFDCDDCEDTGFVICDESDGEGHIMQGFGKRICWNPIHEPDDMSGASEGDR